MDILVIDDDIMFLSYLEQLLSKMKHDVTTAKNIKEAIGFCQFKEFDLILTDVMLPDIKPGDLIHTLKNHYFNADIITMTGDNNSKLESKIREQGVLYYMLKPFETANLQSILSHVASRKGL